MRLSVILILLVLIAICATKSSKSKSQKAAKSKTSKVIETKKHKDAEHKDDKKHKTASKKHDSKKKEKAQKSVDKTANKTVTDKSSNKTDDKIANKTGSVEKKGNSTQATLLKGAPSDCQSIIDEYSNGKILMYEYKIQMKRCLTKAKDGDSTADADVKSALLRPDDSSEQDKSALLRTDDSSKEDSDQAVNVRPYNAHVTDEDNDSNQDEFRENDNDNDNDYSDDDDDDDYEGERDDQAEKKMQIPGPLGYQTPIGPMMNFNMPDQQQGMLGQQAASFYPNMGQTQYNAAPAAPVPHLSEVAFAPSPMNQYPANPAPFQPAEPNMAMNAVVKSNIPDNTQPQALASQANAVFDQWRASSFGEATADKKDQTPNAPVAPANDQFAEFMKMQSASSSSNLEAPPASQQAAMPAATQQRSDIPQQASMFPMQPQTLNTVPGQGQAFYMQPEENGDFPESPRESK